MLFSPKMLRKVLAREKTQTRRVTRDPAGDCPWRPGRTYAVQPGRGKKAVGRILILAAHLEQLGDISEADAIAEGFGSPEEFFDYWKVLHGELTPELPVWALTFTLYTTEP